MGTRGTGKPQKQRNRWRIRWTDAEGERQSEVLDVYNDAVSALRRHEREADEIRRGQRPAIAEDKTFAELCDTWLDRRAKLKRSEKDDQSMIRKHLRPAFGSLTLRELVRTPVEIEDFTELLHERVGEKTVANILTLLVSMLNFAKDRNWLTAVPKVVKPKIRLFDKDFRYLRSDDEVRRFLGAASGEGEHVHVLYAAATYTGMRAGELAALEWSDVDFDRRLIAVQRSFDGPTKSADLRYVPILDVLLPVLRAWRLRSPTRLVFTSERGTMHTDSSARIFQDILHRVLKSGGFEDVERGGEMVRYITFHCLRHTFASHWVMKGGDVFKLQKILGHKDIKMTMRYAHLAPQAFVDDYARFGKPPAATITSIAR